MKKISLICLVLLLICVRSAALADGKVLVALGDSYICGEGIEPFYGQDAPMSEKCQNPDWLAHRSQNSWPGMLTLPGVDGCLADHRGENFFFAAISGARTDHLFLLTDDEKANGQSAAFEKPYHRDGVSGVSLLPAQLDIFDELDAKGLKADYVLVMIGGNDVDFKGILTMAMMRQTKRVSGETYVDKGVSLFDKQYDVSNVQSSLKRAYYDVAKRAGSQAKIIVVGYPYPLVEESQSVFSAEDARIMDEAEYFFNTEVCRIVSECHDEGLNIYYVDVNNVFENHGAYAEEPYINPIILGAGSEDLDSTGLVSAASIHPNIDGLHAYADCVQYVIDAIESNIDSDRYIYYYPKEATEDGEEF